MSDFSSPVDEGISDSSSTISTRTLALDDVQLVSINGRSYHPSYCLPYDDEDLHRLDIKHHIYKLVLGDKLHLAPIKETGRILDLGSGTGIWAIEMADKYPAAEVIGVDIALIAPAWVPPNVIFEIMDYEDQMSWSFTCRFDYIHIRDVEFGCHSYSNLFRKCFDFLQPGGYIEVSSTTPVAISDDNSIVPRSSLVKVLHNLCDAAKTTGLDLEAGERFDSMLAQTGFEDVYRRVYRLPLSPWPKDKTLKEIGHFQLMALREGSWSLTDRLFREILKMDQLETELELISMRSALEDRKQHQFFLRHQVYARRPHHPPT